MPEDRQSYEEALAASGKIYRPNDGVSMMPLLRQHRDIMVISKRPEGRLKKYDAPLYLRPNGRYVLHRIVKVREEDYVIIGDNCIHREYGITDSDIIGVLTAVVRDGKEISVEDWRYKVYVHLWCDVLPLRIFLLRCRNFLKRKLKHE